MTSKIKVNNIEDTSGNAMVSKCGSTITLGKSGDTVSIASGASTTGMGTDDGSNQWDIEKNTVDGGIDVYQITNAGLNYKFFSGSVLNATANTTFLEVTNPGDGSLDTADGIYNNSGIFINNTIKKVSSYVYDDGNSRGQFTLDSALAATASDMWPDVKQAIAFSIE